MHVLVPVRRRAPTVGADPLARVDDDFVEDAPELGLLARVFNQDVYNLPKELPDETGAIETVTLANFQETEAPPLPSAACRGGGPALSERQRCEHESAPTSLRLGDPVVDVTMANFDVIRCTACWYATTAEQTAVRLEVDVTNGLSSAEAAKRLAEHGPNALPGEPPPFGRRFLAQYKSYMQIILVVVEAVVSRSATGLVVLLITASTRAPGGLRQQARPRAR